MGHHFVPTNPYIDTFSIGYSTWYHLLVKSGACYILGFTSGLSQTSWFDTKFGDSIVSLPNIHAPRRYPKGYYFKKKTCMVLANHLDAFVKLQEINTNKFDSLNLNNEEMKEFYDNCDKWPNSYSRPYNKYSIQQFKDLVTFLNQCKGFYTDLVL